MIQLTKQIPLKNKIHIKKHIFFFVNYLCIVLNILKKQGEGGNFRMILIYYQSIYDLVNANVILLPNDLTICL